MGTSHGRNNDLSNFENMAGREQSEFFASSVERLTSRCLKPAFFY